MFVHVCFFALSSPFLCVVITIVIRQCLVCHRYRRMCSRLPPPVSSPLSVSTRRVEMRFGIILVVIIVCVCVSLSQSLLCVCHRSHLVRMCASSSSPLDVRRFVQGVCLVVVILATPCVSVFITDTVTAMGNNDNAHTTATVALTTRTHTHKQRQQWWR